MSSYVDSSQSDISTELPDVGQSWGVLDFKSGELRKIFAESSYDTPYGVTNHTMHVQYSTCTVCDCLVDSRQHLFKRHHLCTRRILLDRVKTQKQEGKISIPSYLPNDHGEGYGVTNSLNAGTNPGRISLVGKKFNNR
jgi:hypothetical protein